MHRIITAAPFVVIDLLGVPANQFGFVQASIVLAFFFGSVLASRLADRWNAFRLLSLGVLVVVFFRDRIKSYTFFTKKLTLQFFPIHFLLEILKPILFWNGVFKLSGKLLIKHKCEFFKKCHILVGFLTKVYQIKFFM